MKLQSQAFIKRLGWVAILAGAMLVILMAALITYFAQQSAIPGAILCSAATRGQFLERIYAALALVAVCGVLAIANGLRQLRSGRPMWVITVAIVALFILACVVASNGAAACNPP